MIVVSNTSPLINGVLLLAHARKGIDHIKPFLNGLRHVAGFYLGEELYQAALAQVKENM